VIGLTHELLHCKNHRGTLELAAQQLIAVGNHMDAGDRAEGLGLGNSRKSHEIADIDRRVTALSMLAIVSWKNMFSLYK
jgi:hypothetical protein